MAPGDDSKKPNESTLSAINYDSISEVQHLEKSAASDAGVANLEHESTTTTSTKREWRHKPQDSKGTWLKGSGLVVFITSLIFLVGTAATLLVSPSLLLVNMKENLVNDLNDSVGAYYNFTKKVIEGQIGGAGCAENSIRCKFTTMSPMLKKRFEEQGIKVIGAKNAGNQRYNVSSVILPNGNGVAPSGRVLNQLAKRIDDVQYRLDNVFDPKNNLFHDRKFEDRLYERFHLQQRPSVSGLNIKDINDSFDEALKRQADYIDSDGRGVFGLHYLENSVARWRSDIYANLTNKVHTHMALACALYTYGNLADDSVRRAKMVTLARFAMQYIAIADVIKSGNNSDYEMVISALSDKLSIADKLGKNGLDGSSFRVPALNQKVSTYMPHGRMYMNDPTAMLLLLSAGGGAPGFPGTTYLRLAPHRVQTSNQGGQSGGSINTNLMHSICSKGMSAEQAMYELSNKCWQPGSMAVASHVGPSAGGQIQQQRQEIEEEICSVTPSGTSPAELAKTAAQAANYLAALQEAIELTKAAIMAEAPLGVLTNVPITARAEAARFSHRTVGVAAQDAIFAGTGIILGDAAQSMGLRPASLISLRQYLVDSAPAHREIARSQRLKAADNQFDISNRHSFLGSIVKSYIGDRIDPVASVAEATFSLFSLLPKASLSIAIPATNALYSQPLNFDFTRLIPATAICGLDGALLINPDFGCNLRYSMDMIDMNRNIPMVVDYMTRPHPENARQSLSEVQERDIAADPIEGARMQTEATEGSREAYVDRVTGKPNMNTEYGKYIRYCVDREYSWGTIGMAVSHVEKPHITDKRDPFDPARRTYSGISSDYSDRPAQPVVPTTSTFGVSWGSSVDQDWMSGKKCLETSDMLSNFRAYTAACRVLAGMSGAKECWHEDAEPTFHSGFYPRNNIIFNREG